MSCHRRHAMGKWMVGRHAPMPLDITINKLPTHTSVVFHYNNTKQKKWWRWQKEQRRSQNRKGNENVLKKKSSINERKRHSNLQIMNVSFGFAQKSRTWQNRKHNEIKMTNESFCWSTLQINRLANLVNERWMLAKLAAGCRIKFKTIREETFISGMDFNHRQ